MLVVVHHGGSGLVVVVVVVDVGMFVMLMMWSPFLNVSFYEKRLIYCMRTSSCIMQNKPVSLGV